MSKQEAVTQSFSSKGYALSGPAYNKAMSQAAKEDNQSSTPSSPPTTDYITTCCLTGCSRDSDNTNPEDGNPSWCTIS